jgi:hypothetical protein
LIPVGAMRESLPYQPIEFGRDEHHDVPAAAHHVGLKAGLA